MKIQSCLSTSLIAFLGPTIGVYAHAEIYMSETQAAESIFPKQKLVAKSLELSSAEVSKIEELSSQKVRSQSLKVYVGDKKDVVFIDQVLGKHEFITYAVGVQSGGKIKGIEIIEYRETYGQKIREANWRAQFIGKDKAAELKLDHDIKNISGATLSSAHVTAGVKRILQTYEQIRGRI